MCGTFFSTFGKQARRVEKLANRAMPK